MLYYHTRLCGSEHEYGVDVGDVKTFVENIDRENHVAAGLEALDGFVTSRTAWMIEHHSAARRLLDGSLGTRARRRLQQSESFEELKLLGECDRDGRQVGVSVCELDEALEYIRQLAHTFG